METKLKQYTVEKLLDGFVYNEAEGKGFSALAARSSYSPSTNATTSTTTASVTWRSSTR